MVILEEEEEAKPEELKFVLVDRDTICSYISDIHQPPVQLWEIKNNELIYTDDNPKILAVLTCPDYKVITNVEFASYGESTGVCGGYNYGNCTAPATKAVVEKVNLDSNMTSSTFGKLLLISCRQSPMQ